MPVFIGDVLESCGGPILDLSTRQIKGIGYFEDEDQRDVLPEYARSDGYVSVISDSLAVFKGGDATWDSSESWSYLNKYVGSAVSVSLDEVADTGVYQLNVNGGFLTEADGGAAGNFLRKGDIFTIDFPDEYRSFVGEVSGASTLARAGTYIVVNDSWNGDDDPTTPAVGPPGIASPNPNQVSSILSSLQQDYIGPGLIRLIGADTQAIERARPLTDNPDYNTAEMLLETNDGRGAEILTSIRYDDRQGAASWTNYRASVSDLFGALGLALVQDNIDAGFGTTQTYTGVSPVTQEPTVLGDLDGDGIITVADILIVLSGFGIGGPAVTGSTSYTSTIVDFDRLNQPSDGSSVGIGPHGFFNVPAQQEAYIYFRGFSENTDPDDLVSVDVTSGGATVTILDTVNSDTDMSSVSSPPGDMVVFSDTPSTGYTLAQAVGNMPLRIEDTGTQDSINNALNGRRCAIYFSGIQAQATTYFEPFVHIYRWDGEFNDSDPTENFYDQHILGLGHTYAPIFAPYGDTVLFNFANGNVGTGGTGSIHIGDLFLNNTGIPIAQTAEGGPIKSVGVCMGIRINTNSNGWPTGTAGLLFAPQTPSPTPGLSISKVRLKFG